MSSSALSKAWRWSVENSPLLNFCRRMRRKGWMGLPNHIAFDLLTEADLPSAVDGLIRKTVKRSKLWANERAEIARELIAHTHDAIEAGRTDEEIAATFGHPKRIAKLMRRSMKRKRPLYWRAYRNMKRATGVLIVLLIVGYGSLAVRFYTGKPSIKRNYIAELNARNDGYREDQKAWGVLAEVSSKWDRVYIHFSDMQSVHEDEPDETLQAPGFSLFPDVPRTHQDYQEIEQAVRRLEPELARLREAVRRPIFGAPIGFEVKEEIENDTHWTTGIIPAEEKDFIDHSAIEVLLPQLSWSRQLSLVLIFDARLAMEDGDPDRAVADILAGMHLARLCYQEPFWISQLVGVTIHMDFSKRVRDLLYTYPNALSREQLVEIAHLNGVLMGLREQGIEFDSMRLGFEDALQRVYTDNGSGNGHLTAKGMEWFDKYNGMWYSRNRTEFEELMDEPTVKAVVRPLSVVRSLDRATERARYMSVIDRAEWVLREGPESIGRMWSSEQEIERIRVDSSLQYSVAAIMLPAMGQSVNRVFTYEQTTQAFTAMLAIETYKLDHGTFPESLDELLGQYLPAMPEDLMNPTEPIKYLRSEGGYVLYSVGSDGDDDGGKAPPPVKEPYIQNGEQLSYLKKEEQMFGFRFPAETDVDGHLVEDSAGRLKLLPPTGPDGDWILIDMRRSPETPPSAPSDD
jgi:hypothetical protein